MFQGFSQQTVDFLWGLKFNNNRVWFSEHKQEFLDHVDAPLKALGAQTLDVLREKFPKDNLTLHVCRIYRDARRLFGRGPYKENLWFTIERPHEAREGAPALYFEVAPNAYSYGCGYWEMSPLTAAKHRARIDRDPKPLAAIARKLGKSRFTLYGEPYKRPKGEVGRLLDPWYNRRNLVLSYDDNCEGVFFTPRLADEVAAGFAELMPLYRYFDSLSGDPAPEER